MIIDQNLRLSFRKVLSRHCSANELEDAVQEAMIHAWTMVSGGEVDESRIFMKSVTKGRRLASPTESGQPLGKPRAETGGYTTDKGRETKQKITDYRETYFKDNGKFPTFREITEFTGIAAGTISHHMNNKSKNVLDSSEAKQLSEHLVGFHDLMTFDVVAGNYVQNEVLSNINFVSLLKVLSEEEREILFLKHHEDLTLQQVATETGNCQRTIQKRLKFAHGKVKEALS